MNSRNVAIYGDSLTMSVIGESLRNNPEFQVERIDGLLSQIVTKLDAKPPDLILFDLASIELQFIIYLLHNHPKTKLIGIDLFNNEMLLLSCEQHRLLTVEDLVKVISSLCGDRSALAR